MSMDVVLSTVRMLSVVFLFFLTLHANAELTTDDNDDETHEC